MTTGLLLETVIMPQIIRHLKIGVKIQTPKSWLETNGFIQQMILAGTQRKTGIY